MTDPSAYVEKALKAIEGVKKEQDLVLWHDDWLNNYDYLQLPESCVERLERAYQSKLGWLYGIGGG